jgi:hypothetical protein
MTTVIINEKTKKGQIIIDLIIKLGAEKIIEDKEVKSQTLNNISVKALREAKECKSTQCKKFDDYLEK